MVIHKIMLVRAADRDVGALLKVNGIVIASVNYDMHGSAGEDILSEVHKNLAQLANIYPAEDEVDDETFRQILCGEQTEF